MPPPLSIRSTAALAGLLALTACGQPPAPNNATAMPYPATGPGEVRNEVSADSYDMRAPARTAAPEPADSGPRNAFIVCPGNPRCPPTGGSRPQDAPPD